MCFNKVVIAKVQSRPLGPPQGDLGLRRKLKLYTVCFVLLWGN